METEDLINLPASSSSGTGNKNDELNDSGCEPGEADSLPSNSEVKQRMLNGEIQRDAGGVENETSQLLLATDNDNEVVGNTGILPSGVELTATVAVTEEANCIGSARHTENGSLTVQVESRSSNNKRDGSSINSPEMDGISISGVKRSRITVDKQQTSVHVMYSSLPRESKLKLEELLQQWSEWHARHYCSSPDSNEVLESGEETYFPALQVGRDKPSAVSFWMDNQTMMQKKNISLDGNSVPLYDRGFSMALTSTDGSSNLEGGLKVVDARCFNCDSYNHALKECPKPRNNAAVNNARKQHNSKRNHNGNSRNPTRYYQNSAGGKYDGLRPGVLDAETRQLLGLGELDPPPWLNRMRDLGYPPGYLDPDYVDQPSGITIFDDEGSKKETEEGEILETAYNEPPRKMSVEYPGLNAPIPENGDERRWAAPSSSYDLSRNQSHRRHNHSSERSSKRHYLEQMSSRDFREPAPPGCDPATSPSLSSYSSRYGGYDSSYSSHSPRENMMSSFGRSLSDRARRSPLVHERSSYYNSYGSVPYSPPIGLLSPPSYGSPRFNNHADENRNNFAPDRSRW